MMRKLYAERPGWGKDFDYDEGRHLVAYEYAFDLVRGKRVLDAGCGEGFGTQVLADVAATAVGFDYSAEAIASSRRRWDKPNLSFEVVDMTAAQAADPPFDVVLNFQVIEHIADEPPFLEALKRQLAPGGKVMITTPNRLQSFSENPCHVREYAPEELRELLGRVFGSVELLGVYGNEKVVEFDRNRKRAVENVLRLDPLGLRRLLPEPVLHFVFARLGQLVRRIAHRSVGETRISPSDFRIASGDLEAALDLVAICAR